MTNNNFKAALSAQRAALKPAPEGTVIIGREASIAAAQQREALAKQPSIKGPVSGQNPYFRNAGLAGPKQQ